MEISQSITEWREREKVLIKRSLFPGMTQSRVPKDCVIEFQGFRGNDDEFIVKELVIADVDTCFVVGYFLFKPPYTFSQLTKKAATTNRWLTSYFHYISWDEGFISYDELPSIIKHYMNIYDCVNTRGHEKSQLLASFAKKPIINYHQKIPLRRFSAPCVGIKDFRHSNTNCAVNNALRLVDLMRDNGGRYTESGGK